MKMILLASAFAATTISAQAAEKADPKVLCGAMASLAEIAMTRRQDGTSMGDLLNLIEAKGDNPALIEVARKVVLIAYETPHYTTEEVQQRTIGDFRDQMHLECLKGLDK